MTELAVLLGYLVYHTFDSRRSQPGFPDLVLLNVRQRRIVFAELKTRTGRLRPMQAVWLKALAAIGLETAVWRPEHWHDGTVRRVLQGQHIHPATDPED